MQLTIKLVLLLQVKAWPLSHYTTQLDDLVSILDSTATDAVITPECTFDIYIHKNVLIFVGDILVRIFYFIFSNCYSDSVHYHFF